jgi:hypothetical protein
MVVAHILELPVEESIGSIAPLVGVGGAVLAIRVITPRQIEVLVLSRSTSGALTSSGMSLG